MADGQPLLIGENNEGNNTTRLNRGDPIGGTENTAFEVVNNIGTGVRGTGSVGVEGSGDPGVRGTGDPGGVGVEGMSGGGGGGSIGVRGTSGGIDSTGVHGTSGGSGSVGVRGTNLGGDGVVGESQNGNGMAGTSPNGAGVVGTSTEGTGVVGSSSNSVGVNARGGLVGTETRGALGAQSTGSITGLVGATTEEFGTGFGVFGRCATGRGVFGEARQDGDGVVGESQNGNGVVGESQNGLAGLFVGNVRVTGTLFARRLRTGGFPFFTIDHPLDPANRYLNHAAVQSAEVKNVYDGVAELDQEGTAWVQLPEWFGELNGDYRYQLTPIGASAPGLYVAEEISDNRFKIAGGKEGMKVSWQVTGVGRDEWAASHPFEVVEDKPAEERGRYLHPELHGQPEESTVGAQRPPGADASRARVEERLQQIEQRLESRPHAP